MSKIDPCETQRNNLIAAALGLQQCAQTDGTEVLIPGTGKRILIGGDAYLAQMAAPAAKAQAHPDDIAVDCFATAMKAKLAAKREQGRGGWETPECADEYLAELLMGHAHKGDPVDVANFAMMLHQRNVGHLDIAAGVLRVAALDFAKRTASMFIPSADEVQAGPVTSVAKGATKEAETGGVQPGEHTQFVAWAGGEGYSVPPNRNYFGGVWHARRGWLGALARQVAPEAPATCGACGKVWDGEQCAQKDNGWPHPVCYPVAVAAPEAPAIKRCPHCDDTGDVHRADGEWMGQCSCGAAQKAPEEVRDSLEAEIMARRIAITPEYEGGFQADEYGDQETPKAKGYGATPSAAIRNLRTSSTDTEKGGAA